MNRHKRLWTAPGRASPLPGYTPLSFPFASQKSSAQYLIRTGRGRREFQDLRWARSGFGSKPLRRQQVGHGFAAADKPGLRAFYENLRGTEAGVVVRALRHAVGAGVEQGHQVTGLQGLELAVAGKKIACLADRPHHVHDARLPFPRPYRHDLVMGLVKRRADEVVHGGVGNDEGLLAVLLDLEDAGNQRPGLGDEEAARLDEQPPIEALQCVFEGRGVLAHLGRGIEFAGAVVDAQSTAGIDRLEVDALALEWAHELPAPPHGRAKGVGGAILRADVNADAVRLKPAVAGRTASA